MLLPFILLAVQSDCMRIWINKQSASWLTVLVLPLANVMPARITMHVQSMMTCGLWTAIKLAECCLGWMAHSRPEHKHLTYFHKVLAILSGIIHRQIHQGRLWLPQP